MGNLRKDGRGAIYSWLLTNEHFYHRKMVGVLWIQNAAYNTPITMLVIVLFALVFDKIMNVQGITLYIILGILVAAIIGFLFVSSVLDRKKRKKILTEKHLQRVNEKSSNMKVAIILAFVIKQNQKLLDAFVPSVGVLKMSDIRNKARQSLRIIEKSPPYLLLKQSDTLLTKIFERFKARNSNVWQKNFVSETNKIMTMSLASHSLRTSDAEVKTILKKIKKVYA